MLILESLDITNVVQHVSRSSNILHFDWYVACNDGYEFRLYQNDILFYGKERVANNAEYPTENMNYTQAIK